MKVEETGIKDCKVFTIDRYHDDRGYFQELFNYKKYEGISEIKPQVSFSNSQCDVLRGLHISPYGKLCTCVRGSLWDVMVDLRIGSSTYGKYFGVELNEINGKQLYIPPYCAHGFLSLEDDTSLLYLQGGVWSPTLDKGVKWNDCKIGIEWPLPIMTYIVSEKDWNQPSLEEYEAARDA